jgi:hypothetical protein
MRQQRPQPSQSDSHSARDIFINDFICQKGLDIGIESYGLSATALLDAATEVMENPAIS